MELQLQGFRVRSFKMSDAESLARHANNRKIWQFLRDRFPHPYVKSDAQDYIRMIRDLPEETLFAIDVDGAAVGAVGYMLLSDIDRVSAENGYWLGEPFWGRGIATDALRAVTRYAIDRHRLTRVFAVPFATNPASCRVLEKAGFVVEGRMRRSIIKDGQILDSCLYAFYA